MRSVAAVVALVICVHAGLWALLQRQQAVANIDAPLASISYSPYSRSQHPDFGDRPLVADMSSDILSRPFDANKFSLIYAGGVHESRGSVRGIVFGN